MSDDSMIPRIAVPGGEDAELVFAALIDFQVSMARRIRILGVVDLDAVRAMRRAADLAYILGEDITSAAVREMVDIPDDLSGLGDEKED
jgi:hypothetical protein